VLFSFADIRLNNLIKSVTNCDQMLFGDL